MSGYVAITALGVSVYDNRWELAAYEVGSDLKLGARFPINNIEGQDFKASLDDVKFEVSNIDPAAMIDQVMGAAVLALCVGDVFQMRPLQHKETRPASDREQLITSAYLELPSFRRMPESRAHHVMI